MIWKGSKNFRVYLERGGYEATKADMGRLSEALGEYLAKPPTQGSLKTACLGVKGRGYSKVETMEAICKVLKCEMGDLYESGRQADAPKPLSTWEWVSSGVNLEDHQSWPV